MPASSLFETHALVTCRSPGRFSRRTVSVVSAPTRAGKKSRLACNCIGYAAHNSMDARVRTTHRPQRVAGATRHLPPGPAKDQRRRLQFHELVCPNHPRVEGASRRTHRGAPGSHHIAGQYAAWGPPSCVHVRHFSAHSADACRFRPRRRRAATNASWQVAKSR